jgi:hypothetical protein
MQANTFDVIERRKRVTVFKLGKLWVFKQFFDNHELFNALLDYYNKDQYRFEFKSTGARNNALKLLERNGFDYDLVEDLKGYMVQLPKSAKYAQVLKNSSSPHLLGAVQAEAPRRLPARRLPRRAADINARGHVGLRLS